MGNAQSAHGKRYQDMSDLVDMPRFALVSHFRRKVDDLADKTKLPRLMAFLPQNLWPWVTSYLKYVFRRKHAFLTYPSGGDEGCYLLRGVAANGSIRISIAGDWGTGTQEADQVASHMLDFKPDYTIHLGDVYYVGDPAEIAENCLGQSTVHYQGVTWPKGALGSFALNSNHEMYANGNGYFDTLIKTLGIPLSRDRAQLTSFFCLQNDVWRILGLDTGYNSIGLPILGGVPLINRIPGVGPSCKLEDALITWLETVINPVRNPRATIVLTHHEYFSSFDESYTLPARQLMQFFADQDVLWLWGHEHRLAIYDKYADNGIGAFGRCVGHGGMPIEIGRPRAGAVPPLQFYDGRAYASAGSTQIGFNGFVNIKIEGDVATLDYRDVNNMSLLAEEFHAKGSRLAQVFKFVHPELTRGIAGPNSGPSPGPTVYGR
jgi:hypothetical protein